LGLVNRVVPHDELMPRNLELATQVARGPRVAFRYIKENVALASIGNYAAMLDREALSQQRCSDTEGHKEGMRAFIEKRAPRSRDGNAPCTPIALRYGRVYYIFKSSY
jgi:2-(1,2-epoxy-1,2-dihydrophenyl)acetyl-CoA isomerase